MKAIKRNKPLSRAEIKRWIKEPAKAARGPLTDAMLKGFLAKLHRQQQED